MYPSGASFKLELIGPDLSSRDRAIIREAGGGCPGRADTAESEARRFSVSVATYVYHSQGSYLELLSDIYIYIYTYLYIYIYIHTHEHTHNKLNKTI